MPGSAPFFDDFIAQTFRDYHAVGRLRSVLDIGPGMGKYGRMARAICPDTRLRAVEPTRAYVRDFDLASVYDEITIGTHERLFREVDARWDVAILGDVIEHMRKSDGIDLLNFLYYRCFRIVVVWPHKWRQGSSGGVVEEAHISHWSEKDFESFPDVTFRSEQYIRLAFVAGLSGDSETVGEPE